VNLRGEQAQDGLSPLVSLVWVFKHLYLIDNGNVVDFLELCGVDSAADYCWVKEILLLLPSV